MTYNVQLISTLSMLMVITSFAAVEARNLRYATAAYVAQALLICSLLVAYSVANTALILWAVTALITKAMLTPMFLWGAIKYTGDQETRPIIGFGPSVVVAIVVMVLFYNLTHRHASFLAHTPAAEQEVIRTNLSVAFTVFAIGLYGILTRRDAIKTVIGLCLLENGVHLSLVSLAPMMKETALAGIATEVVITVYLLLYIISRIQEEFGSTDTFKLSELHW